MKKIALIFGLGLLACQLTAGDLTWLTDLPKAQAQAKKDKKMVFIDFTGSDWCGWCIRLKKELFDTKEFADYAAKNLVLVEVDFPRRKKLDLELKKANDALGQKYRVDGFPTILVLNSAGKEAWKQVGYLPGGPTAWIEKLDEAKKK